MTILLSQAHAATEEWQLGGAIPDPSSPDATLQNRVFPELAGVPHDEFSVAAAERRLSRVSTAARRLKRGAAEARLYRKISPSVVLVLTSDGLGSGSVISQSGGILTNWHVIAGNREVGVIYKPVREGGKLTNSDVRRAVVVRIDEVADLALLRVLEPLKDRKSIALGAAREIEVGSDVHAIGHPTGESWTYTKGIISQVRQGYSWQTADGKSHSADVVQTQTPINPGNSGGPLFSNAGTLLGVNSFTMQGEGLNFAVSVGDVSSFLSRRSDRFAPSSDPRATRSDAGSECEPRALGRERLEAEQADAEIWDMNCDGQADGMFVSPDDQSLPHVYKFDTSGDGQIDELYVDPDRDGKVDRSFYDTDGDGRPDMTGYHANGDLKPYRLEPYRQ